MIRRVIRNPKIYTTPKALAMELGVKVRAVPNPKAKGCSFEKDFLMTYPETNLVTTNRAETYRKLHRFWSSSKASQREEIQESGVQTPKSARGGTVLDGTSPFVVRPLRHHGGRGFRITRNGGDYSAGSEYIAELFAKNAEYRIVFVYGKPVVLLRKVPNAGTKADEPWNYGNSHFESVDFAGSNLSTHTSIFADLGRNFIVQHSHVVAVDVLYKIRHRVYSVCEFNSSPGITIPDNLKLIAEAIRSH